jgi:hypothetical protein
MPAFRVADKRKTADLLPAQEIYELERADTGKLGHDGTLRPLSQKYVFRRRMSIQKPLAPEQWFDRAQRHPFSKNLATAAALQIQGQDPEEHEDDPPGHGQSIDGQEGDLKDRLLPGSVEGEKEVGRGLAEEEDQEDDAKGRAEKVLRGILKGHPAHEEQGKDQPGR